MLHLQPLYLLSEENVLTECHKLVVHDVTATSKFPLPSGYVYLHSLGVLHEENILLDYLPKELA